MKKNIIILMNMLLALAAASCGAQKPVISEGITDGLGREIALEAPAARIVSLSPPVTEMLFAIGAGEQVVGRDTFSDYPQEALALPDVGGGFAEYDLETIVSLRPDLVIAGEIHTPEMVQSLEDLDMTVFYLSNPADLEGTFAAIQTLGTLSDREEEANALVKSLRDRSEAVRNALQGIQEHPTVYYELDATDPAKPYTPGPDTFYTALIEAAGGENIGAKLSGAWAQTNLELLLSEDPQFILLGDAMWGVTPESLAERPGWSELSAVREGRVLPFDDNLIARIGPRQVDGLEALARVLHPEAFE